MTRALAIAALLATLNTQALPVVSLRFATIPTGTAYYRIRSMDRDGRTTCTPVVSLTTYPTRTAQRFDILGRLTR